jgi:erythromycin esterase
MRCAAFSRLQLALFSVILLAASEARAQRPLNLGFERRSNGDPLRPWGWTWFGGPAGTTVALDSLEHRSGRRSLRMSRPTADSGAGPGNLATLRLFVPPLSARGRIVRVTAWAKTRDAASGARFSLEAWTYGAVLAADSGDAWETGTRDWTRIDRTIPVDSSAHAVVITLQFRGSGSAWFDDLAFSIDGRAMESVPVAPTPAQADREWMAGNTWPLRTADADGGDDRDLDAFRRIVGDARVISLGEDTHGTSEHFRMKHRLTRFMVEQMGARVFAIEANQLAVEPINRYVREGVGEVGQVMRGMFAVWNTEEMKAMIEWMRAHNAAHPSAMVSFVGYDMQDPSLPIDSLRAFLTRRDAALLPAADRAYTPYREAWRKSAYPQAPDSVRQGWRTSAESMWREVSSRATTWLSSSRSRDDSASVEWAIQNANVVRQAALAAVSGRLGDRDSAMAANIDWILSRHGDNGRVVVWAHNGHVARDPDPKLGIFGGMSMGTYLSARLGDALRVFGLVSYEGQYRGTMTAGDRRFINVESVPAPIGSIEEVLHGIATRLRADYLVADLRPARSETGGRWLLTPRPTRMIGYAATDFDWEQMVVLPRVFDAVVFVDRATASRGIVR